MASYLNVDLSKSLLNVKVDPGYAPNVYSTSRVFIQDKSACPPPTTFDIYGRMVSPITQNRRIGNGCNALDPVWNVQQVLANENALRPANKVGSSVGYDTMGVGRDMIGAGGGYSGEGAWQREPPHLQTKEACACSATQPVRTVYKTTGQTVSHIQYQG